MSETLLPTKFFIPRTRPELVARSRLIRQLNDGLHRPLTLVSAPAGFGKTTLVVDWVGDLRINGQHGDETCVAWLSLDESDNGFNRFVSYFFTAITRLACLDTNKGMVALDILQSPNPAPIEAIFSTLISDLAASSKKIVLVLDDYHLIGDLRIHKALNFWLENLPPQVHTVVITREDPPFPLARLRARNHLTELRVADLRFTVSEVSQFLNEVMGLQLDEELTSLLGERTEGWIAGLQMAALSMRDRKDVGAFIKNFSGTNRYILDYLMEEVLTNQSPEIKNFLLHTSILKRLAGPLCDVVMEWENHSASILEYLEQANLFLIPLDDDRTWYRYHHLFADLLNARLQQTCTDEELSILHTRAAHWHEKNKMTYGAIYHASLIPSDEWVERIIDKNYMEIFQRKDSASIRYWTGELGEELIFKRPQLAIHEANSRAWFGQLDEANHLLDEAEKRLSTDLRSPEHQAMLGYLAYVRSRVSAMKGNFEQAIQLCLRAMQDTPSDNEGLLGGIGVMLGYGYFLNGEFTPAIQTLEETIRTGEKSGAINTTIGAYCVLARLFALQGFLQKAYDLYRDADVFIQRADGQHQGAMSIVNVGFAEILYEWNDLEAAMIHLQKGLESIPLWGKADDLALAHVIHAKIQQALGDEDAAEKLFESGSAIIQSSGVFSEARDAVITSGVELWLRHQNSLAAVRWAKTIEGELAPLHSSRFENELTQITLGRVYLAQKKHAQALVLLGKLEEAARSAGRTGRLIRILTLKALALSEADEKGQAFSALENALELGEQGGFIRVFVDEGQPMFSLLSEWLIQADRDSLKAYVGHLLAQFIDKSSSDPDRRGNPEVKDVLVEPLSSREIEVLSLIAQGKTNKEISSALVISPGTVKAHTSNIYRKLDVANRTEAVARAREHSLLP